MSVFSRSGIFRPADVWKSSLMTLPENSFFELLRSVFGNIKTPFNKQKLLDDLFTLLSRNEIRKVIAAYIDESDHKIIAAVALLNEPTAAELEPFFAGDFSPGEIHSLLLNLEERLILYRLRDEGVLRLSLNPVLEKVLEPFLKDTSVLFSAFPGGGDVSEAAEAPPLACVSDAVTMAALTAFLLDEEELLKTEDGAEAGENTLPGFRKKVLDAGKKIFPEPDIEVAAETLLRLGLLRIEGRGLVSDREKIKAFGDLPLTERLEYWTACVYLGLHEAAAGEKNETAEQRFSGFESGFRFSRNQLKGIAGFIRSFESGIDPEKLYPETTLGKFAELLRKAEGGTGWASSFFESRVTLRFDLFLQAMEKTGLLKKARGVSAGSLWKAGMFPMPAEKGKNSAAEKPVIAMDTAFSFILYPEITFVDALTLAEFCSVKDRNALCLTRESAVRGFDRGIKARAMLKLLEGLSLNRLDPNLGWTLEDWEKRYSGVALKEGIVLRLEEDRRYLAGAAPVSSMIREILAPGVYLLSCGEKAEAVKALKKAGVDIIARRREDAGKNRDYFDRRINPFPRLAASGSRSASFVSGRGGERGTEVSGGAATAPEFSGPEAIKEKFRRVLETMKLGKQERDELLARIERRLVLNEAQLEGTSLRYEKLEARGLDYAGKSVIAKQAVENGYLLEVSWPGQGGETNRCTGIPSAFEKKEGENILVIVMPDKNTGVQGETIRIPLGKISLIRRIKQSIFGE